VEDGKNAAAARDFCRRSGLRLPFLGLLPFQASDGGTSCLTDDDPQDGGCRVQRAAVNRAGVDQGRTHYGTRRHHLRVADVELIVATKQRNARLGHNPRTGEVVAVGGEKARPFFMAGKDMRGRLNRGSRPASEHPT
jgi:hypothetical protein